MSNCWETQKPRALKIRNSWWQGLGHLGFGVAEHAIGTFCLFAANASGRQADGSGRVVLETGQSITTRMLARQFRLEESEVEAALQTLIEVGTLARTATGDLVVPNLRTWQEDPSAARKRRQRAREAIGAPIAIATPAYTAPEPVVDRDVKPENVSAARCEAPPPPAPPVPDYEAEFERLRSLSPEDLEAEALRLAHRDVKPEPPPPVLTPDPVLAPDPVPTRALALASSESLTETSGRLTETSASFRHPHASAVLVPEVVTSLAMTGPKGQASLFGGAPKNVVVETIPPERVQAAWEQRGGERITRWTEARRQALRRLLRLLAPFREPTDTLTTALERYFDGILTAPFCRGENERGWKADFNFVLGVKASEAKLEEQIRKSLEGVYIRLRKRDNAASPISLARPRRTLFAAEHGVMMAMQEAMKDGSTMAEVAQREAFRDNPVVKSMMRTAEWETIAAAQANR